MSQHPDSGRRWSRTTSQRLSSLSRGGGAHAPHLPEESRGIEPLGVTLARFSRPLADHSALPSIATHPGFEPGPGSSEPPVLPLHQRVLAKDEGFEPSRYGFGDRPAQPTLSNMARLGFEPRSSGYEPDVEPLHYRAEPYARIELANLVWKTSVLPLHQ